MRPMRIPASVRSWHALTNQKNSPWFCITPRARWPWPTMSARRYLSYYRSSGEVSFEAPLFVMALGFSNYLFIEAHSAQDIRNCVEGRARAFTLGSNELYLVGKHHVPRGWLMDSYGTVRLAAKNAESAIITRICKDFNLIPVLARAYYEQMARYFAE